MERTLNFEQLNSLQTVFFQCSHQLNKMSLFVSLKNCNQSKNLETIDVSGLSQYSYIDHWLIKIKSAVFTAMLPGELASSAGNYDGIQTANFMYNVVIINADNALNPSAKMCIL